MKRDWRIWLVSGLALLVCTLLIIGCWCTLDLKNAEIESLQGQVAIKDGG